MKRLGCLVICVLPLVAQADDDVRTKYDIALETYANDLASCHSFYYAILEDSDFTRIAYSHLEHKYGKDTAFVVAYAAKQATIDALSLASDDYMVAWQTSRSMYCDKMLVRISDAKEESINSKK